MPRNIVDADLASSYLATERTFLAWVRTALAVLGFGLAFANLFPFKIAGQNMGSFIAISSIASSLILLINATIRYYTTIARLENGKYEQSPVGPAMLFCIVILLILIPGFIGGRKQYKIKKAKSTDDENYSDETSYASSGKLLSNARQNIAKTVLGSDNNYYYNNNNNSNNNSSNSDNNNSNSNANTDALLREMCLSVNKLVKVIEASQKEKET